MADILKDFVTKEPKYYKSTSFNMSLIIYKKIDSDYVEESLMHWKLLANGKFRDLRAYALVCMVYLIIAIIKYNQHGIFWSFWMSVGIAFLILTLVSVFGLYKGRYEWILRAKKCVQKHVEKNETIEYTFLEDIITGKDGQSYFELKWAAFSNYQVYKNYLLFYSTESNSAVLTLDKNKIAEDVYFEVLKLTQSKLAEIR